MALNIVAPPYPVFTDRDGTPLENGYVYIGVPGQDAETNPIEVFWDEALTIPAPQPIRTVYGYLSRSGSPAKLYANRTFSMTVKNSKFEVVFSALSNVVTDPTSGRVYVETFTGDGSTTQFTMAEPPAAETNTQVYINGVYQNKDGYTLSGSLLTFSEAPPAVGSYIEVVCIEGLTIGEGDASQISYEPAGSGAVTTTVQNKLRETVSVKDFGAVGDGITDDTAAIQAALNSGAGNIYFPEGSYFVSTQLSVPSNTKIQGVGNGTYVKVTDGSLNCFYLDGVSGVIIRDLQITTISQTNYTAYKCAVLMYNECRNCLVENVSVFNWGWAGVCIWNSSHCIVRGCRFSSWFGTVDTDRSNIHIRETSNYNLIDGNYCFADSEHGIFVQDPYTNSTPVGNEITNNVVKNCLYSGICVYVTTAYDTQTLVSGNHVSDIVGSASGNTNGHGIYIQSAGGSVVTNNILSNCCQQTTNFETQAVGAIGVSTGDTSVYPTGTITEVIVANNHILAQRGPAINIATCGVPVLCSNNTILSTGTTAVRGEAIYCVNANGVKIANNAIKHSNTNYAAINLNAVTLTMVGTDISGNTIRGAATGINFGIVTGGSFENTVISSNTITGLSGTALFMADTTGAQLIGNSITTSGAALSISNSTYTKASGNRFSGVAYSIATSGTCTGSVVDQTNYFNSPVDNSATGLIITTYGTGSSPWSGNAALGDRVINSAPSIGQPKAWVCTVAGGVGSTAVFTSEGNL